MFSKVNPQTVAVLHQILIIGCLQFKINCLEPSDRKTQVCFRIFHTFGIQQVEIEYHFHQELCAVIPFRVDYFRFRHIIAFNKCFEGDSVTWCCWIFQVALIKYTILKKYIH